NGRAAVAEPFEIVPFPATEPRWSFLEQLLGSGNVLAGDFPLGQRYVAEVGLDFELFGFLCSIAPGHYCLLPLPGDSREPCSGDKEHGRQQSRNRRPAFHPVDAPLPSAHRPRVNRLTVQPAAYCTGQPPSRWVAVRGGL